MTAVQADPDGSAVIAAVIAGLAKLICTRDRHFRNQNVVDFCAQRGIRIVDEIELLTELRATGGQAPVGQHRGLEVLQLPRIRRLA